jgi:hypothetical protein
METCAGRELEAVSDVVDNSRHPIGPVETGPELPFGRHLQGGWSAMTQAQLDPIAHGVAGFTMILVVVALVDGLCLLQLAAGIGQELIPLSHAFGYRSDPGLAGADGGRVAAIDDLERRVPEGSLKGGVVDVLRPCVRSK